MGEDQVPRRGFLLSASGAAVAAAVGGVLSAPSAASAATTTVPLVAGAGQGLVNRGLLQTAVAGLAAGDVLEIPAGTFEVDTSAGAVLLPRSIVIQGVDRTASVLDVFPKVAGTAPLVPLFDVVAAAGTGYPVAPNGSKFVLRDLTVHGPTSGVNVGISCAFRWARNGSTGDVRIERVTITGLFDSGVQRSGKGLFEIIDCDINAFEAPVKAFESSNSQGEATCIVLRGTHTAFGGKSSSVGIYIHPNVSFHCQGTHYQHFNRFAFYANGSPSSPPSFFSVVDVEVEAANLAQTATNGDAVFVRVKHHGVRPGLGESAFKGNVTFVECDLRNQGQYGFFPGSFTRQFISCWIQPTGIFMSMGASTSGLVRYVDCTWKLEGNARACNFTAGWTGRILWVDSKIADCGTTGPYLVQVQGGSIDIVSTTVDSPRSNHGLLIGSTVPITGQFALANSGTCPPTP